MVCAQCSMSPPGVLADQLAPDIVRPDDGRQIYRVSFPMIPKPWTWLATSTVGPCTQRFPLPGGTPLDRTHIMSLSVSLGSFSLGGMPQGKLQLFSLDPFPLAPKENWLFACSHHGTRPLHAPRLTPALYPKDLG